MLTEGDGGNGTAAAPGSVSGSTVITRGSSMHLALQQKIESMEVRGPSALVHACCIDRRHVLGPWVACMHPHRP
jgi:hypothetical protein